MEPTNPPSFVISALEARTLMCTANKKNYEDTLKNLNDVFEEIHIACAEGKQFHTIVRNLSDHEVMALGKIGYVCKLDGWNGKHGIYNIAW
jgi:hypothetical protein